MQGLIDRVKPKFQSNWHSFGEWILYPQGWQVGTPDADYPIYVAHWRHRRRPGDIAVGFDPGHQLDELYVTNGETTDYADTNGTIAFTPELGEGTPGPGSCSPTTRRWSRPSSSGRSTSRWGWPSRRRPDDPVSPVGIEVEPFYLDQADIDPQNGPPSMFDFKFDVSYGDPQEVRVLAQRSLGHVTVQYRINGGRSRRKPTSEWNGGEVYGVGNGTYYRVMSGRSAAPSRATPSRSGSRAGARRSDSFNYEVESDTGNRVLVLAAEDYTGASPVPRRPDRGRVPVLLHRRAERERRRVRRLRRRCQRAHGARRARRAQPLRRRHLVHGQRRCHPRARLGAGQRVALGAARAVRGPRLHQRGRAVAVHRQVRRPSVHRRPGVSCTTRSRTRSARPTRRSRPGCPPLLGSGDSTAIRSSTGSEPHPTADGGTTRTPASRSTCSGSTPRSTAWTVGVQRRRQRPEPGPQRLVHHDQRSAPPDPADYPQFESWRRPVADRPAGPFDPHTGSRSCTRIAPTSPTSG